MKPTVSNSLSQVFESAPKAGSAARAPELLSIDAIGATSAGAGATTLSVRLRGFDGLRGISIIAVMICHSDSHDLLLGFLGPLADARWGVMTFFAVSGFLISHGLLQELRQTGSIDVRAFWTNRFAKLVPSLGLLLTAVWLLGRFGHTGCAPSAFLLAALFGTALDPTGSCWYLAHTWSLSVEECFYISCVGLLLLSTWWPRARLLSVLFVVISPTLRVLNWLRWTAPATHAYRAVPILGYFDTFVIVGLAAYAIDRWGVTILTGEIEDRLGRWVGRVVRGTPSSLAIGVDVFAEVTMNRVGGLVWVAVGPTLHAVVLALLCLKFALGRERGVIDRLLEVRLLKYLGLISYSLYLTQQIFLVRGSPAILGFGLQTFPLNWVIAIGIAAANYHWFEEPMRLRIRRVVGISPGR